MFEHCIFAICAAIPTTLVVHRSSTLTPDGLPLTFHLFPNLLPNSKERSSTTLSQVLVLFKCIAAMVAIGPFAVMVLIR